jgi:hypothetical protein
MRFTAAPLELVQIPPIADGDSSQAIPNRNTHQHTHVKGTPMSDPSYNAYISAFGANLADQDVHASNTNVLAGKFDGDVDIKNKTEGDIDQSNDFDVDSYSYGDSPLVELGGINVATQNVTAVNTNVLLGEFDGNVDITNKTEGDIDQSNDFLVG